MPSIDPKNGPHEENHKEVTCTQNERCYEMRYQQNAV